MRADFISEWLGLLRDRGLTAQDQRQLRYAVRRQAAVEEVDYRAPAGPEHRPHLQSRIQHDFPVAP